MALLCPPIWLAVGWMQNSPWEAIVPGNFETVIPLSSRFHCCYWKAQATLIIDLLCENFFSLEAWRVISQLSGIGSFAVIHVVEALFVHCAGCSVALIWELLSFDSGTCSWIKTSPLPSLSSALSRTPATEILLLLDQPLIFVSLLSHFFLFVLP